VSAGVPLGTFHCFETRDAVAGTRDGWPNFAANSRGVTADGQPLFEIQFGDGQWTLAVLLIYALELNPTSPNSPTSARFGVTTCWFGAWLQARRHRPIR
jgi:hypothetical protein